MSRYEHISIGYHDSSTSSLRRSTHHHLASLHPFFDSKTSNLRLCSPVTVHRGRAGPPVHGGISSKDYFCPGMVMEAPRLQTGCIANGSPFPQPYECQEAQYLETSLFVSLLDQGDRCSDPLLGGGIPVYTDTFLRPPLAGTDSPTATESEEPHSRSKIAHSRFINESFPLSTASHFAMRHALSEVMASPWKLQNDFEPRQSTILLSFLEHKGDDKRWFCFFYVNGTRCPCSFSKKDQAKNHIRFHIEHLPFCCSSSRGICPKDGVACFRRFCSAEALQKHRGPQKNCTNCGKLMLKSNLRRHSANACRNRRHRD